jgi:hypothetical protein
VIPGVHERKINYLKKKKKKKKTQCGVLWMMMFSSLPSSCTSAPMRYILQNQPTNVSSTRKI